MFVRVHVLHFFCVCYLLVKLNIEWHSRRPICVYIFRLYFIAFMKDYFKTEHNQKWTSIRCCLPTRTISIIFNLFIIAIHWILYEQFPFCKLTWIEAKDIEEQYGKSILLQKHTQVHTCLLLRCCVSRSENYNNKHFN